MTTLDQIKERIIPVLRKHNINRAGLFGSYVTNQHTEESDIDILIQLGEKISLLEFVRIKLELEDKLNRKVDIVEYQAIKPRLKDSILSEEVRIYG